jgi:hypothetical protein
MEGVEEEQGQQDADADQQQQQQQQQTAEGDGDGVDVDMQEAEAEGADGFATQQQQHEQQQQQQVDRQQVQPTSGKGSSSSSKHSRSSSSAAQDFSGTPYEAVLLQVLQGLQQQLPSTDPAIQRLLQDAPVLPLHATLQFLQQLLQQGSSWAVLALDSVHALIEGRPPMRQQLLQVVLHASVADEAATREHAVRLLVSQLLGWESFANGIVEFAQAQLLLLLEPRKLLAARQQVKQEQQDEQQQANDAAGSTADDQQQQQQSPGNQPDSSGVQVKREQQDAEQQQQQQDAEQQPVKQEAAGAEEQQQQQQDVEPELDVEVAAQQCMLFMSLCAGRPELMRVLLETYGKAGGCKWGSWLAGWLGC